MFLKKYSFKEATKPHYIRVILSEPAPVSLDSANVKPSLVHPLDRSVLGRHVLPPSKVIKRVPLPSMATPWLGVVNPTYVDSVSVVPG